MIVRRFYEPLLAQASYLIGCTASGQAIVIDANRSVQMYLDAGEEDNLRITHVTETHIHADYLSGSRELARRTGATLLLSREGGADWQYAFAGEGQTIGNGDRIAVGTVVIDVLHTPGHTPEHLTFLVTDGAAADTPMAALTGDFIFVGDVGRPDLLERAAHLEGTMEASARVLYRSLQSFAQHDDWLQIWPGHGAGSACGKGISAVPHSTLGYERRFNWAFRVASENEFVRAVLEGQPDPPVYFATMKRLNREGPPVGDRAPWPPKMDDGQLLPALDAGAVVIDTRPARDHAARSLPGTLSIPLNASFLTWAGWLVPYDADLYLLIEAGAETRLDEAVRALSLIGLDRVKGYFASSALDRAADRVSPIESIEPEELARLRGDRVPVVVDVRNESEWRAGHLPSALHVPLGRLPSRLHELPRDYPLVTQCASGNRSVIAASVLRRAGIVDVKNLEGGYQAWVAAGLPTDQRTPAAPTRRAAR